MRTTLSILTGLFVLIVFPINANQKLEKITVTDTNNFRLGSEYTGINLPDTFNNPEFDAIRRYFHLNKTGQDDLQDIIQIAQWVHSRWTHDPFGSTAPKTDALTLLETVPAGSGFSCSEYSKVLRDMFRANGFIARIVTLQNDSISYGGLGSSHVAVEVFHNQMNKWLLIDAQWGFYPTHNLTPLNAYEIFQLKKSGKYNEIIFIPFSHADSSKQQHDLAEYRAFLESYFGYITVELLAGREKTNVLYPLEGKEWPLTFQALPRNAQIFADHVRELYFDLNRVSVLLRYNPESQRLQTMQLDVDSEQDYLDKMPMFAAVPDYTVTPQHNMPWFDYYEYRIDDNKWIRLTEESFSWHLKKGSNLLEVRAVNAANRPGHTTYIKIKYE
jgi:hypothetical protein